VQTEVAIVGGGLAGLALADLLHRAGVEFRLFEARPRLGGRIAALEAPGGGVDLGPSWFWPGQPRIARLVEELGLRAFPQHAAGDTCFEDERGAVHRGMGFASMEGAFRIDGGMVRLIEGLAARLPGDRLHLSTPVAGVGGGVTLADGTRCAAPHVALAIPPRVAAGLTYRPPLPPGALRALRVIPTWMAGQAKFVAVYAAPFWREAGLSGDAMSRRGPLVEIHDASGPDGVPAALFGFVGVPAAARAGQGEAIAEAALAQFGRIFGPEALSPAATALMDWATQPETSTDLDLGPPGGHPEQGLPAPLAALAEGGLHFAATETAPEMGGLMEGALASAERTAAQIIRAAPGS
jgi:monoamine oxidase